MFKNEYHLDLDIKSEYTSSTPVFRRGDTSILKMRIFDNTILYDMNNLQNAEVTIIMPSGFTVRSECTIESDEIGKLLVFQFGSTQMIEIGRYNIIVTAMDIDKGQISVQPFKVRFFDSLNNSDTTVFQLIQDLQNKINQMENSMTNTIKQREKGISNGVASLDSNAKIPENQMPTSVIDHVNAQIYLQGAHGFRINPQGQAQYRTPDGRYQNAGFAPYAGLGVTRLILTLSVAQSVISLKYSGVGSVRLQKWAEGYQDISHFANSGTTFTGLKINIENIGSYTVYYLDDEGNEYLQRINVVKSDIAPPDVKIYKELGVVALLYDKPLQMKKYDTGVRTLEYFHDNGKMFAGNSVRINKAGTYTAYYMLMNGLDYVQTFEMLPGDLEPDV